MSFDRSDRTHGIRLTFSWFNLTNDLHSIFVVNFRFFLFDKYIYSVRFYLIQAVGKFDNIIMKVAWIVQVDKLNTIVDCSCVNFDHIMFRNFRQYFLYFRVSIFRLKS